MRKAKITRKRLPGRSFRRHGRVPVKPQNGPCARAKSRENGCLAGVSAATAGSRQEPLGAVRRCRRSRSRGRVLKWPNRPCARPKSRYQAPAEKKKNSAPLRYQSPPGVLGPGMTLGYSRRWCRGCPKTAARQRKTAAWQRKTAAWQQFRCHGRVPAGTVRRCRRSRPRGRVLKWQIGRAQGQNHAIRRPAKKKKNSAPLRYQSPPGVLGPGMALRYSRGWCRGCPKTAAWQRKTAAWQQFPPPRQGPGRKRSAPFADADGPGRAARR